MNYKSSILYLLSLFFEPSSTGFWSHPAHNIFELSWKTRVRPKAERVVFQLVRIVTRLSWNIPYFKRRKNPTNKGSTSLTRSLVSNSEPTLNFVATSSCLIRKAESGSLLLALIAERSDFFPFLHSTGQSKQFSSNIYSQSNSDVPFRGCKAFEYWGEGRRPWSFPAPFLQSDSDFIFGNIQKTAFASSGFVLSVRRGRVTSLR